MINLTPNSTIFLLCPAQVSTGGPESLHLLSDTLIHMGFKCEIVYLQNAGPGGLGHPGHGSIDRSPHWQNFIHSVNAKPVDYKNYNSIGATSILDDPNNLLIVPEIYTNALSYFNKIQKGIWWLASRLNKDGSYNPDHWFDFESSPDVVHFYNSYGAQFMLLNVRAKYLYPLQTFVNPEFNISTNAEKEDIVAYNPRKGQEYTAGLIRENLDLNFEPIHNLSRAAVKDLLERSKVYIDFGHHPGRERIPREACLSNCCVITNKNGTAKFHQDIPIPERYKIEHTDSFIPEVSKIIRSCLSSYENCIEDFAMYKRILKNNQHQFNIDVNNIFGGVN